VIRRLGFLFLICPALSGLRAQDRLIGNRTLGLAASVELITFSGGGLREGNYLIDETARVTKATQFNLPVTAAIPLGDRWRIDVTTLYAHGSVTYLDSAGREISETLNGVSDVRLRATGRVLTDALTLTVGVNAPSGRTGLTGAEFATLRILAAPALGLGSTPVGTGPSGTIGVVLARDAGPWALAFGASFEHRGRYQPLAAITAGAPSADFRPGGVVRGSVGGERPLGPHRLSIALATDVFFEDRLRGVAAGSPTGTPESELASVRLGPVVSADVQLLLAAHGFRELIAHSSYLLRTAFTRDGRTADGSSGQYLEGGLRGVLPLAMNTDVFVAAGGRWHSGLRLDQGLPTAGVRSVGLTVGLNVRRALLSFQPFVRGQAGMLQERGTETPVAAQSFRGLVSGLVVISRF
jgi:hypothetical protein